MIEPKYAIGDRVVITVADDMFSGQHATIRSWKRRRKPQWRISYVLDIDGKPRKWGAGPYGEDEIALLGERTTPASKVALYDALAQHLIASLPSYYTNFDNVQIDPRYDSGDAQEAPTYVMEMEIDEGWLHIEMGVQGWADSLRFSVELPTLTREDQT